MKSFYFKYPTKIRCTRYLHQMYKVNVLTIQMCTRLLSLKEFNQFSKTCSLISLRLEWETFHSHISWWHTHPMHFFFTSYMFIRLPTPLMMNKNINWVQFSHFPWVMTMETWLIHPYTHIAFYVYEICISIQGIYTKCTM